MKTRNPAVAALAALYSKDPISLERCFQHLTPPNLDDLDAKLMVEYKHQCDNSMIDNNVHQNNSVGNDEEIHKQECYKVIAQATIRRTVHQCLKKYQGIHSSDVVEKALKHHSLPTEVQAQVNDFVTKRLNGDSSKGTTITTTTTSTTDTIRDPKTWYDALCILQDMTKEDRATLWTSILEHPMTSYVPVQCQTCSHVIRDEAPSSDISVQDDDVRVGIEETEPKGDELELRGGWFRGRPRPPKLLRLNCPECSKSSIWYRSSHPQVILNPNRWGRLCGEQEDLRLDLASYLNIPIRTCIPLDWDHIWSEFLPIPSSETGNSISSSHESANKEKNTYNAESSAASWCVHDPNARNFAVRLNEGIGAWTGIFAIHPNSDLCEDVTNEYLTCKASNGDGVEVSEKQETPVSLSLKGRIDTEHISQIGDYRKKIDEAREDSTAALTQAKTLNGYAIYRSHFFTIQHESSDIITQEIQRAAKEFGTVDWWQLE